MHLHSIPKSKGAHRSRKRLGRGEGNGHGKTAGKGHKGQKARSGGGIPVGFEGGQMPLYRKLPRRGFNNHKFRTTCQTVSVGQLAKVGADTIDRDALVRAGLVRDNRQPVKLLGDGEAGGAYTVHVDKASASAKSKVEAAGGSVTETSAETAPEQAE